MIKYFDLSNIIRILVNKIKNDYMAIYKIRLKLLSGVFKVRPNKLLTLNAGGMIRLTPKKEYLAFRTNFEISNQPGKDTIMIIHEDFRYFPVSVEYAKGNFEYIGEEPIEGQGDFFDSFNRNNQHIRNMNESLELQF